MTHVISTLCTREGDCVEVCPVDCIVPGNKNDSVWGKYFYIDPDTCIDCGACVPVCPPAAVFPQEELPAAHEPDTDLNARLQTLQATEQQLLKIMEKATIDRTVPVAGLERP